MRATELRTKLTEESKLRLHSPLISFRRLISDDARARIAHRRPCERFDAISTTQVFTKRMKTISDISVAFQNNQNKTWKPCPARFAATLFLLFALFAPSAYAQIDFFDYQPLEAEGPIPETVREQARIKYAEAIAEEDQKSRKERRRERKAREGFLLSANFAIDDLLTSGRVLFGDTLTRYVNRVVDVVLKDEPRLRRALQVYVVKSQHVNAFASDEGYIFVNIGLLAQLENEAQLAFILCHEIAHFAQQHSMELFMEREEIKRGNDRYRGYDSHERLLAANHYNREIESEADDLGWNRFIKTPYAVEEIVGVFDVLLYAYLPYDEIPFDSTYFNTEFFQLPEAYYPEEPNPITAIDDYDDTLSTHPNVRKRREAILDKIEKLSDGKAGKRKAFVVSEEGFHYARQIARYEMSRLYLLDRDYEGAIYNAWLSLSDAGLNLYQEKVILKSLYAMAAYANEREFTEVHRSPYKTEGEMHALVHIMHELTREEQNLLALVYAEELRGRYDFDPTINALADSIVKMFVFEHVRDEDEYARKPPAFKTKKQNEYQKTGKKKKDADEPEIKIGSPEYEKLSKYEKIKLKRKLKKQDSGDDNGGDEKEEDEYYYALAPYFQDETFAARFDAYLDQKDAYQAGQELTYKEYKRRRKNQIKSYSGFQRRTLKRDYGYFAPGTNVERLVMVQPEYFKAKLGRTSARLHLKSEVAREAWEARILETAREVGLDVQIVSPKELAPGDIEAFNAYARATEFINERYSHDVNGLAPISSETAARLKDYYNTRFIGFSGVAHLKLQSGFSRNPVISIYKMMIYAFLAPPVYYHMLRPRHVTLFVTSVYDLETGRPAALMYDPVEFRDTDDVKKSLIYNHLYTLKHATK